MLSKLNSKQRPLAAEFYFRFQFRQMSCCGAFLCVIIQNFSEMTRRPVTVSTAPFTKPDPYFCHKWVKCQPGNTQNGGTVLKIANLMENFESVSPDYYSNFLVTILLSRSVSETLARD